jgi:hypothetical protein
VAVANYRDTYGHFPPAFVPGPDGRPWHSWRILILPYVEQQSLFQRYRFDEPWDGPNNRLLASEMPRTFAFPDTYAERLLVANYLAVVGPETLWPGGMPYKGEMKDGLSETIQLVENHGLNVHWMEPRDLSFDDMSFELQQPTGISSRYRIPAVLMADTTLRSLGRDVSPDSIRAMLTANAKERLNGAAGDWQVIEDGRNRELRKER